MKFTFNLFLFVCIFLPLSHSQTINEIPKMKGDEFLGDIKIVETSYNWDPWKTWLDFGTFYTENPTLVENNSNPDYYYLYSVGVNYLPNLTKNLFGNFLIRQDLYDYNEK